MWIDSFTTSSKMYISAQLASKWNILVIEVVRLATGLSRHTDNIRQKTE
jgi:hypothetical protein